MVQKLAPPFERLIQAALGERTPESLASDIMALSDFYLSNPGKATPWHEDFAVPATLAYFMPLNYARVSSALREVVRFIPDIREVWDFGSGLGTTQWALEDQPRILGAPLFAVEIAERAREEHLRLSALRSGAWRPEFKVPSQPGAGALAVFSYSFLEMQSKLPRLENFEHVLIVEPSTRECGRDLMAWRAKFIEMGFTTLAPCTHVEPCPLLVHSKRDWCHHRIHFAPPEWWSAIEAHLPMKNRTLTYSYLLLSRTCAHGRWHRRTRVIGDTLHEKGKTRQLICRGQKREFLSWLHREGEPPLIPHGALIDDLGEITAKGDELRVRSVEWEE